MLHITADELTKFVKVEDTMSDDNGMVLYWEETIAVDYSIVLKMKGRAQNTTWTAKFYHLAYQIETGKKGRIELNYVLPAVSNLNQLVFSSIRILTAHIKDKERRFDQDAAEKVETESESRASVSQAKTALYAFQRKYQQEEKMV